MISSSLYPIFFKVHYRHSVLVCCYAASCSVHPLTPKQRNLQRAKVKLSYLHNDTKVAVFIPIIANCINTHTAILVHALFVMASCVKCISIDPIPLVLDDCGRRSSSKPLQLYINRAITHEFPSKPNRKAIYVMTCNPGLRLLYVFRPDNIHVLIHIWGHEE